MVLPNYVRKNLTKRSAIGKSKARQESTTKPPKKAKGNSGDQDILKYLPYSNLPILP